MSSTENARTIGALYLLSAVTAGVPLIYVSSTMIVPDSARATADRILASEVLFRASMVSQLIGAITLLFVVRALYRLLCGVNKTQASLMVTLVQLSVPITFLSVASEMTALTLLRGDPLLSLSDRSQRDLLAMVFLSLHDSGVNLASIFWGLWLVPFGALVARSVFLPRVLGILLILNGIAVVAVSLTTLLLPTYQDLVNRIAIIPELGELWMMIWLLVKGVKVLPTGKLKTE